MLSERKPYVHLVQEPGDFLHAEHVVSVRIGLGLCLEVLYELFQEICEVVSESRSRLGMVRLFLRRLRLHSVRAVKHLEPGLFVPFRLFAERNPLAAVFGRLSPVRLLSVFVFEIYCEVLRLRQQESFPGFLFYAFHGENIYLARTVCSGIISDMKTTITAITSAAAGIAVAIALQGTIKGCVFEPNSVRQNSNLAAKADTERGFKIHPNISALPVKDIDEARKNGKDVVYVGTDSNGNAKIDIASSQNKLVVVTNKVKVVSFH